MDKKEQVRKLYYEELDFCGCGNPQNILKLVKTMLNYIYDRYEDKYKTHSEKYEEYNKKIKQLFGFDIHIRIEEDKNNMMNDGIYLIVMNTLDNVGLVEHGSSIYSSWLTSYGEEIRGILNTLSDDEIKEIL